MKYLSVKSTETGAGSNVANDGAKGNNSVAIGPKAKTVSIGSVAIGLNADAKGFYAVALGQNTESTNSNSIAIGNAAKSKADLSIAMGKNATTNTSGAIAIGKDATTASDSMAAMAIGYEANATGVAATAVGPQAKALSGSATAVGFDSVIQNSDTGSGREGNNSVAFGVSSKVNGGNGAIAIGNNANFIDTTQATVVGTGAMVSALPENAGDSMVITDGSKGTKTITKGDDGEYTVVPTKDSGDALKERNGAAYGATALGSRATAHNLGAVAAGLYATAIGDTSVAIGNNSMTLADSATAVGSAATATAEDSLAIGGYTNANVETGVALGAYAKTDRAAGAQVGYDPLTGDASTKTSDPTWNSTLGAVSVGTTGKTRQITNVAAGFADTDAVNVAQLKAAKVEVVAGTNVTVATDTSAAYTKYTVNSVDTDTKVEDSAATYNADGTGSITLNTNQNGTKDTVTISGLQDKYITGASMSGNTLTINRNDGQAFTVDNIATKDDVTTAVGNSSWTLGVGKAPSIKVTGDSEATANGEATEIKNGSTVTLRAERGIKINQDGSNIDIGLKYIDVDPAVDAQPLGVSDAKATGGGTTAVGQNSIADGHQGTALGFGAHAGEYSLAVGSHADASSIRSLALGYNTSAGQFGVAAGSEAKATGNQSVAVGTFTQTNGVNSIGIGISAVKLGAVGSGANDFELKTNSDRAIAIGSGSYVGEKAADATVIGVGNKILGLSQISNNAVLIGTSSSITDGTNSILLGNEAGINNSQSAVGIGNKSSLKNSTAATAVGYLSTVENSSQGTAVGGGSKVTANQATAVGGSSEVTAAQGVAMGYKANASVAHGVALGAFSQANRGTGYTGYNPLTGTVMANDELAIATALGRADDLAQYNATMQSADTNSQEYVVAKMNKEILLATYKPSMSAVSVGRVNMTRQITNVAAGLADTDAVNVAQLKQLRATGTNYAGDDTTRVHRDLGDELTIKGGADISTDEAKAKLTDGNIGVVANKDTNGLEIKLVKDINLTDKGSVVFGDGATAPKLDATGLILPNTDAAKTVKVSTDGISAGSQKITNVAAATADTDAVNVSQLNAVKTSTDDKLGKFTVGTDAAGNADGIDVDKDNTRFDILGANGNITTTLEGRQVKVGLSNTLNLTADGSIAFGNDATSPKLDAKGLTVSDTVKFTNAGISAGAQQIKNVKAGTDDTDAVNVSQLNEVKNSAAGKLGGFTIGADAPTEGENKTITVNKDNTHFDVKGVDNIKTEVKGNAIEVGLAKDVTLTDGSVTTTKDGVTTKVDGSGITITPSKGDAAKAVSLTNEGLNNGGNKITNVADGDITDTSKDAINGSQLKGVKDELQGNIDKLESKLGAAGDLTTVDKDGNPVVKGNDGNYYNPTDLNEDGTPKDDAKPVDTALGSGADTSGLGLDNKDNDKPITKDEAKDIIGGKPGADGQPGKDGLLDKTGPSLNNLVTVKDLQALAQAGLDFGGDTGDDAHRALSQKLTINGGISDESKLTDNNIGVVANGSDTLTVKLAKDIDLGKDGSVTTGNTTINNDGLTVKGEDGKPGTTVGSDGMGVNGDDGKPATTVGKDGISTNGKDGISVNGEDGSSTTIKPDGVTSKDPNGNSTVLGPNGVEVKDKDSNTVVTINDKGISNNNGGPTNLNDGLNVPGGLVVKPAETVNGEYVPGTGTISAEGNRIQNVAPGIEATDAVNVGQLGGVKRDLSNRMNTIGAHAAAMAALHPMEYLEDEKLSVAAGVGTFHSKQAVAVGAFYRPNDDTMFSVGGSFGGSENMFNLGVSLRVGQDNDYAKAAQNYKQAPLSTMTVLDEKVTNLEKENADLKGQLEEQRQQIKMLMERLGVQ
ncbi:YadA-like family protein [uncultured Veillonella sp.]|uniref:YadA-like family protein n=1 Tax=uncultured Veillonella sp. TaxID=159268 RepID=UPI002633E84F|nr:YadA-like family protein [uncultured Veillonella sp.]